MGTILLLWNDGACRSLHGESVATARTCRAHRWVLRVPCRFGIAALHEGVEGWVFASEGLRGGVEEGDAGDQLESVGAATHQVFERTAAGELLADGAGDFFVARADPPSLKLRRGEGRSACLAVALA